VSSSAVLALPNCAVGVCLSQAVLSVPRGERWESGAAGAGERRRSVSAEERALVALSDGELRRPPSAACSLACYERGPHLGGLEPAASGLVPSHLVTELGAAEPPAGGLPGGAARRLRKKQKKKTSS